MTVSYFVLYRGQSRDHAAFLAHYRDVHVPILLRFPGMQRVTLHSPINWTDPEGVNAGEFALIAQMEFANSEALAEALASPARVEARQDMNTNFPAFEGIVLHQAASSESFFDEQIKNIEPE